MTTSWNKDLVIKELQARRVRGLGMHSEAIQNSNASLSAAMMRYFGSHDSALRAAGIIPPSRRRSTKWDQSKVVAALRDRQTRRLEMGAAGVYASHSGLYAASTRYFGSYDAALVAAGIDPASVRQQRPARTDEEIFAALRAASKSGKISYRMAREAGIRDAARLRFGSVESAAKAAGLEYVHIHPAQQDHYLWTQQLVLQTLRDLHRDGHDLSFRNVKAHKQSLFVAAREFFGTYLNAVKQAGIDYPEVIRAREAKDRAAARVIARRSGLTVKWTVRKKVGRKPVWDKAKIVAALHARQEKGLEMNMAAVLKSDRRFYAVIIYHFVSFDAALTAAGIDPDTVRKAAKWDKDQVIQALRERSVAPEHVRAKSIVDTDRSLSHAIRRHFGSLDAAARAAGLDPASVRTPPVWDRLRIFAALAERRSKGQDLGASAIGRSNPRLLGAIQRFFSSHDEALRTAGIDPASVRKPSLWNKDNIVEALRARRAKGLEINFAAVLKSESRLSAAIKQHFGSFDAALRAAGFDPATVRKHGGPAAGRAGSRTWDHAKVVAALQQRRDNGHNMSIGAIQKSDIPLAGAIQRYFGSHDAALVAAGIDPAAARQKIRWDKDKVIAALRERLANGLSMNYTAIRDSDERLIHAAKHAFGSLDEALRAVGVDPASTRRLFPWDKGRIVAALRERRDKGLALDRGAIQKTDTRLAGAIYRYFHVHDDALRAAGIDPAAVSPSGHSKAGHWTEEIVLRTLRDLHREGQDLRYRNMKERSQPLFFAAKEFFGSYVNAVKQAGIDYWEMSQAQLAKQRAAARRAADDEIQ